MTLNAKNLKVVSADPISALEQRDLVINVKNVPGVLRKHHQADLLSKIMYRWDFKPLISLALLTRSTDLTSNFCYCFLSESIFETESAPSAGETLLEKYPALRGVCLRMAVSDSGLNAVRVIAPAALWGIDF